MADNRRAPTSSAAPASGPTLRWQEIAADWPEKTSAARWSGRVASARPCARGVERKRRRALRGEAAASRQPRVLCRPFLARRPLGEERAACA